MHRLNMEQMKKAWSLHNILVAGGVNIHKNQGNTSAATVGGAVLNPVCWRNTSGLTLGNVHILASPVDSLSRRRATSTNTASPGHIRSRSVGFQSSFIL